MAGRPADSVEAGCRLSGCIADDDRATSERVRGLPNQRVGIEFCNCGPRGDLDESALVDQSECRLIRAPRPDSQKAQCCAVDRRDRATGSHHGCGHAEGQWPEGGVPDPKQIGVGQVCRCEATVFGYSTVADDSLVVADVQCLFAGFNVLSSQGA